MARPPIPAALSAIRQVLADNLLEAGNLTVILQNVPLGTEAVITADRATAANDILAWLLDFLASQETNATIKARLLALKAALGVT